MPPVLTTVPIRVAANWLSKTVTTDPPRYTPHDEWMLMLKISADVPIRVAVFLSQGEESWWGLWPDDSATDLEVRANFFPYDWAQSDEVQISFGWQRVAITDPELKADPRQLVHIVAPSAARTAEPFCVADLPAHGIRLEALALAEPDTEVRRQGRWRLKPELAGAMPERFLPLASGKQNGVLGASLH